MLAVLETPGAGSGLDLILGGGRGLKLATIARRGTETRVMLRTTDDSAAPAVQFEELLGAARAAGAIPDAAAAVSDGIHCLAGVALEMESHVGKRCALIGDAGGFASAFSNDSLYPALRSGWLAAEAVARALGAPVLQDELASFGAAWRADLAAYLQMPNTDLGLLMPMVFSNPQMSARVARAFLLGQAL